MLATDRVFAAALVGLAGLAPPTLADFSTTAQGLAAPVATITFDEVALSRAQMVTTEFAAFGVTFTPFLRANVILADFPGVTGNRLGNSAVAELNDPFSILFTQPRTAVSFALASNRSTMTFTALLDGRVVETATAPSGTSSALPFYGFTGIVLDEVRVSQQVLSGSPGVLIDNIQLGPAFVCAADFNSQGGVTLQDLFDFLAAYFAGAPNADVNQSGSVSVQDVFDFLAAYIVGCP